MRWHTTTGFLALGLLALLIVTEGWSAADIRAVPRPMREGAIPQGAIVMDLPMER